VAAEIPDSIVGDPVRLRQVIVNLVGNAIKFTEHGEVGVRVEMESRGAAEARLLFTVSDTGIGISREKQHLIFEAFSQADTSTTREYGGTGLGLTIASRLVELMGGSIAVDSEPNQGSAFRFTVTVGLNQDPGQRPAAAGPAAQPFLVHSAQPKSELAILVAEDNPVNQKLAVRLLEKLGHQVHLVDNGEAAVRTVNSRAFDVVLMDLQMPVMGGLAACTAIREQERARGTHIPIIAMTAHAMQGDRGRCLQAGMDGYVSKPIDAKKLLETIEQLVGNRVATVPEGSPEADGEPTVHPTVE
jgi:CheY-like chemotaxis protein